QIYPAQYYERFLVPKTADTSQVIVVVAYDQRSKAQTLQITLNLLGGPLINAVAEAAKTLHGTTLVSIYRDQEEIAAFIDSQAADVPVEFVQPNYTAIGPSK